MGRIGDDCPWIYVAEGKKHAVFAYDGDDFLYSGKILRVAKSGICAAAAVAAAAAAGTASLVEQQAESDCEVPPLIHKQQTIEERMADRSLSYIENVVRPLLGQQYVDIPQCAIVNVGFAARLWKIAKKSGKIPANRLPGWNINQYSSYILCTTANEMQVIVMLLPDHTIIVPFEKNINFEEDISTSRRRTLSIEIKPKAGYVPCSPLIDPSRRIKLLKTRYHIHQRLLGNGHIKRGWGTLKDHDRNGNTESVLSTYNPLDLFSFDKARIKFALECLIHHPQNNLKIWNGGRVIIGYGIPAIENDRAKTILSDTFPHIQCSWNGYELNEGAHTTVMDRLVDATIQTVADILMHEPLLSRIRVAQMMDNIDADGAIVVWNHLLRLCDGNVNEAETLVDNYRGKMEAVAVGGAHSNNQSAGLATLQEKLASFRDVVQPQQENGMILDESYLDKAYHETKAIVHTLNKEDSAHILTNWLFSLAMCDISLFVTLRPSSRSTHTQRLDVGECAASSTTDGFQLQTEGMPGHFTLWNADSSAVEYAYEVKIVDCDAKPSSKLKGREESEKAINLYK